MKPPSKPRNVVQTLIDSGDHPVTAQAFFLGACEYWRGARVLAGDLDPPLVPFAQLVCQSIELGLKSYLIYRGFDEQRIKGIGHDLERAWEECRLTGLEVKLPTGWLLALNAQYNTPFTYRYWRKGLGSAIPGDEKSAAETLYSALAQICDAIGDYGLALALLTKTPPPQRSGSQ